ncbi:ATP-binding cassette subfamily B protein/ATP-binding cassette subfamily C protein/ATP-binding cassette subfamily B multidrug efflux pump [Paucibacter oligotrophus]|uniref:ATP-binding cassette subfamily B protein/ATP-binding cassette subfamily C protein/ATP-binding cassette subfamily B multidrug efflux pump n=1 Tax=Roseateles oligotrophus TaxID=1769250 RepID=A0A840LGT9_9BURK|nr:ATP-binding cassette domain-containing protein [Roseateles oligotrophus]MBB4845249.1 ATP-binding cassette subfamily B protein/ATP-binding cassette subfamily C protein/ATP-binding cassette subfamily B multidrug efflux pump [Roseateles oligotrophus]
MTLSKMLLGFVRRHWRSYAAAALMLACIAVLSTWIPRQVGHVVDGMVAGALQGQVLLQQLGLLVAAGAAIYLLRVGWRLALFAAAYRLGQQLRTQLYARLTLQGPVFFQAKRSGDLMALATNDVDAVEMAAGEALLAAFDGTLTLVLVLLMMTVGVDWRLGLAALLPFPLMALAFWRISDHIHQAWQSSLARFSKLNQHVQEGLASVRTLRALGLAEHNSGQFRTLAASAGEASYQAQRWEAAYEPAVGMTLSAATVIALGLGGLLVARQELSIGQLTAFTMYLGQLIWPMFAAGWVLSLLERGRAAWDRLLPVLEAPLSLEDKGLHPMPAQAGLSFEHLSFSYAGAGQPALQDIQLQLRPGQTLGLVGPTGAGKSTLLNLLLRQFEASQGRIAVSAGGQSHDLAEISLQSLRAAIAWVPQEPFLFSASIAENIALTRPGATRAEVEQAARMAAVHEDIARLPQGYETEVGERGVTLSGGQRQRVAIARALLSEAPILLLDDALSAVDTGTETQILDHLRELRQARPERSVIIVSHRLSAVMEADQIAVLRKGRISEQGSHAQLLEAGAWYASQWRYQQLEASLDAL